MVGQMGQTAVDFWADHINIYSKLYLVYKSLWEKPMNWTKLWNWLLSWKDSFVGCQGRTKDY